MGGLALPLAAPRAAQQPQGRGLATGTLLRAEAEQEAKRRYLQFFLPLPRSPLHDAAAAAAASAGQPAAHPKRERSSPSCAELLPPPPARQAALRATTTPGTPRGTGAGSRWRKLSRSRSREAEAALGPSRTTTPSGQRGPAVPGSGSVWVATAVVANRTLREDIGLAGSCEYGGSFFSSGARRGGRTAILELLRGLWCHVPTRGRPQPGEPESLRSGGGSALSSADGGGAGLGLRSRSGCFRSVRLPRSRLSARGKRQGASPFLFKSSPIALLSCGLC